MEAWQQEEIGRSRVRTPLCQCCGEPIRTEWYLDLEPFGLSAAACERCVEKHTHSGERSRYV